MKDLARKNMLWLALVAVPVASVGLYVSTHSKSAATVLPNGFVVSPAGKASALPGDMPRKILFEGDGREVIASTVGYHDQGIYRLDAHTGKILQSINVGKSWTGMCATPDSSTLYLSSGGPVGKGFAAEATKDLHIPAEAMPMLNAPILVFKKQPDGSYARGSSLAIQGLEDKDRWVSGLAISSAGALFAANLLTDTLYKLDPASGAVLGKAPTGYRPYGVALSPDGKLAAVSNWGDKSVSFFDTGSLQQVAKADVGDHPCDLVWDAGSTRLFVACSGGDTVAVVNAKGVAEENIRVSPDPSGPKVGTTPLALTLSKDGKRLFVADAGLNCIAVVDTSIQRQSRVLGFIPTGWYPSAVAVSPNGKMLYVGVGKGMASRPNVPPLMNDGQTQPDGTGHMDYVMDCLSGAICIIQLPDAARLAAYSQQVASNIPHPKANGAEDARLVEDGKKALSHIKHVVYVIRENRTYDQVLGDDKRGNGDPNLALFGLQVTPNAHKLADDTVLLDNFYCDGEVSEDGHEWCNAAYATDFKELATANGYSYRGEPDADDRLSDSPAGALWDACRKHGVSFLSYGEGGAFHSSPNAPPVFYGEKGLEGHLSLAWSKVKGGLNTHDTARAKVFLDDLKEAERTGVWPQYMVMHLYEDHTMGLSAKAYTPVANVASNDQALGEMVEGVSKSRFWKDTVFFVLEDDAQDGADHVDCHRSVALVVSPYSRRGIVDHTHYTTSSFVRTIELILGLPPMTEFDDHATPLYRCFTDTPDLEAFNCQAPLVDLEARNPSKGSGAQESAALDFSDVDRADPAKLNAILWHALRPGVPQPAPVHSFLSR